MATAKPITMDYETIITELMKDYENPCDAEIPAGSYRRVKWEGHSDGYPAVGVEWDTEIIKIGTHLYTAEPFGHRSTDLPIVNPELAGSGILVPKIGYYFATQAEIDAYIVSIGATKIGINDWYGADLLKSALYKNPRELAMYRVENSGGYLSGTSPVCDQRIRQSYNSSTGGFTDVNYYWNSDRIAYMKHDPSPSHQCKYTGLRFNTNADTSIPPIPDPLPSVYGSLPAEVSASRTFGASMLAVGAGVAAVSTLPSFGCVPATVGFPYTNISNAMLEAWNETRKSFKLMFDMLTGGIKGGSGIGTVFDNLSIAMEELTTGALALSQQAWQTAVKVFKNIMDSAFSIVGGAFDMIKSMLPKITIMGVSIDIYELIFGNNSVQSLKNSFSQIIANGTATAESVIQSIYTAIGSAYEYSVEYVKAEARDLVDACTTLFDWCCTMFQNGCVALIDMFGRMLQIFTMPPIVPNPLWSAVLAIRNILTQIKPLDIILGGNFPGFTSADLYQMAQEAVKKKVDAAYVQIKALYQQATDIYNQLIVKKREQRNLKLEYDQYLAWMKGAVTDAGKKAYEDMLKQAQDAVDQLQAQYDQISQQIQTLKDSIKDVYSLAMAELKKLPIVSTINQFLGYCGLTIDTIIQTYENSVLKVQSLYKNYSDGSRSFKDTCKAIYNQICTLALSKITQYVNKLLSLIGMIINFGSISVCVPMVKY